MNHSKLSGMLRSSLSALFACSSTGRGTVRVRTPFMYPDGDVVDVFVGHAAPRGTAARSASDSSTPGTPVRFCILMGDMEPVIDAFAVWFPWPLLRRGLLSLKFSVYITVFCNFCNFRSKSNGIISDGTR